MFMLRKNILFFIIGITTLVIILIITLNSILSGSNDKNKCNEYNVVKDDDNQNVRDIDPHINEFNVNDEPNIGFIKSSTSNDKIKLSVSESFFLYEKHTVTVIQIYENQIKKINDTQKNQKILELENLNTLNINSGNLKREGEKSNSKTCNINDGFICQNIMNEHDYINGSKHVIFHNKSEHLVIDKNKNLISSYDKYIISNIYEDHRSNYETFSADFLYHSNFKFCIGEKNHESVKETNTNDNLNTIIQNIIDFRVLYVLSLYEYCEEEYIYLKLKLAVILDNKTAKNLTDSRAMENINTVIHCIKFYENRIIDIMNSVYLELEKMLKAYIRNKYKDYKIKYSRIYIDEQSKKRINEFVCHIELEQRRIVIFFIFVAIFENLKSINLKIRNQKYILKDCDINLIFEFLCFKETFIPTKRYMEMLENCIVNIIHYSHFT